MTKSTTSSIDSLPALDLSRWGRRDASAARAHRNSTAKLRRYNELVDRAEGRARDNDRRAERAVKRAFA